MRVVAEEERLRSSFAYDDVENQIAKSIRQPGFTLDAGLLECACDFGGDGVDVRPFGSLDAVFMCDTREDMQANGFRGQLARVIDEFVDRFAKAERDAADAGEGTETL